MSSDKRPSRPHSADIEFLASLTADELRFDESPETEARFFGQPGDRAFIGVDSYWFHDGRTALEVLPGQERRLVGHRRDPGLGAHSYRRTSTGLRPPARRAGMIVARKDSPSVTLTIIRKSPGDSRIGR